MRRGEAYLEREKEQGAAAAAVAAAETRGGRPSVSEDVVKERVRRGLEKKQRRAALEVASTTRSSNSNKDANKTRARDALRHADVW